ncbi:hypothetical protein ACWGRJ_37770 [Bradyrhizobium sp. Lot11]
MPGKIDRHVIDPAVNASERDFYVKAQRWCTCSQGSGFSGEQNSCRHSLQERKPANDDHRPPLPSRSASHDFRHLMITHAGCSHGYRSCRNEHGIADFPAEQHRERDERDRNREPISDGAVGMPAAKDEVRSKSLWDGSGITADMMRP